jgi:hypothetical protein
MGHSKKTQVETFAPLGELAHKMLREQIELFETFEIILKDLEQNLDQLEKSLETLLEKLLLLQEIIQPEEKKFPL